MEVEGGSAPEITWNKNRKGKQIKEGLGSKNMSTTDSDSVVDCSLVTGLPFLQWNLSLG